jgi:hypothetical protein
MKRYAAGMVLGLALISTAASAEPVYWNTWSSASAGQILSTGGSVGVSFSTTNSRAVVANYPSWTPTSTFADGNVVANGPVASNGIMQLTGGTTALNTLTFSVPVENPVIAIWSLGQSGVPTTFEFSGATPTLISGGSNAEYGGASISVSGNIVTGIEGNGTVRFEGQFTELQWTNPVAENWYGFNVGITQAVPEPGQMALFGVGLGLLLLLSAGRDARRDPML